MRRHLLLQHGVTVGAMLLVTTPTGRALATDTLANPVNVATSPCYAFTSGFQNKTYTSWNYGHGNYGHESCTYTPARYLTGHAGDVVLTHSAATLQPITNAAGMSFQHAAALYDNSGSSFTESFWDGVTPPASTATGEPHQCGIPLSPYCLARLNPGTLTNYTENAVPGTLVSGMATPYCSVPSELYHFSSFLDLPDPADGAQISGGSCEKILKDYCGTPVNDAEDKLGIDAATTYNTLNAVWNYAYGSCMGTISWGFWESWFCHANASEECGRAAYQVVNEIRYKGNDHADGWTERIDGSRGDVASYWSLLGDAKDTGQTWYTNGIGGNNAVNGGGYCSYNVYGYNGAPPVYGCPGWLTPSPGLNMPDNIEHAATRLGKAQTVISTTAGNLAAEVVYCCGYSHTSSGGHSSWCS